MLNSSITNKCFICNMQLLLSMEMFYRSFLFVAFRFAMIFGDRLACTGSNLDPRMNFVLEWQGVPYAQMCFRN